MNGTPSTQESTGGILARVHALREARRWSQRELADRAGLSTTQMSRLTNGQRKLTASELGLLADALGVTTSELLGDDSPQLGVAARIGTAERTGDLEGPFKRAEELLRTRDLLDQVMTRPLAEARPAFAVPTAGRFDVQGKTAAQRLRAELGIVTDPIEDLEGLAARFGIDVSTQTLPANLHGLLVVDRRPTTHATGGATAVALLNGNDTAGRRRYTLAHEIGHMIFADAQLAIADYHSGDESGDQRWTAEKLVELRANTFSAHLLTPDQGVREVAAGIPRPKYGPSHRWAVQLVVETALRYRTSYQSACYRADDAGLLDPEDKARVLAVSPYAAFESTGHSHDKDLVLDTSPVTEPPAAMLSQALGAYQSEILGLRPLASLYDLSTDAEFDDLREQLAQSGWAPAHASS